MEIQKQLVVIFTKWGIPKYLRADNGKPFGQPQRESVPLMTLWLVGLSIQPQWIRPSTPTDNAVVERAQQTTSKWLDLPKINNIKQCDNYLKLICERQIYKYKVKRLDHLTRIKAFPCLLKNTLSYHKEVFEIEKVIKFLAQKTFSRRVSKAGQISILSQEHYVGTTFYKQTVYLKLNQLTFQWEIRDKQNTLIKICQPHYLTKQNIIQFKLVNERSKKFRS